MRFSANAFNAYDDWGKDIIKAFLNNRGHIIVPNPDRYGVDLYSDKEGKLYRWEVEVKTGSAWRTAQDFPYDTVSFLGRKEKWKDFGFYYCIICKVTEAILIAHSDIIFQDAFRVEKYIGEREEVQRFYHVPKELCTFTSTEL